MIDSKQNPRRASLAEPLQTRGRLAAVGLIALALSVSNCVAEPPLNGSSDAAGSGGEGNGSVTAGAGGGAPVASGGSSGPSSSGGAAPASKPLAFSCKAGVIDPGPSPMKLLSRSQYLNGVRDLVGSISGLESALGASSNASAFGLVQPDVAQVDLENYRNAASTVASKVVANAALLKQLAPCGAAALKRDCAKNFVQSFAPRAYRAPLTGTADVELHLKLYDVGAKVSHEHGIELLLQGILQAPRFLYRVEIGTGELVSGSAVKLSPYELAARLSFAVWDSLPDAKLTAAASSGALDSKQGVSAQLEWMRQDEKGKSMVRRFLESWVHLPELDNSAKDETLYPEWSNTTLKASMKAQARAFFDDLLTNQGGKLSALLTSRTVFVNKDLGPFYGVTGGEFFTSAQGPAAATAGVLTLPAFLALLAKPSESSPIYRGKFVREQMLCQLLPAPPANIPKPPDVTPGVSTRERLRQHETDPSCSACHRLMDPIGFGFENYDALGKYRTLDGAHGVDVSGELIATGEIDGPFTGVVELGQRLSESETVRQCMARQWFRFALARFEQPAVDDCSMKGILDSFEAAGADLNTLPKAIVESDAFLYRQPIDAEVSR